MHTFGQLVIEHVVVVGISRHQINGRTRKMSGNNKKQLVEAFLNTVLKKRNYEVGIVLNNDAQRIIKYMHTCMYVSSIRMRRRGEHARGRAAPTRVPLSNLCTPWLWNIHC